MFAIDHYRDGAQYDVVSLAVSQPSHGWTVSGANLLPGFSAYLGIFDIPGVAGTINSTIFLLMMQTSKHLFEASPEVFIESSVNNGIECTIAVRDEISKEVEILIPGWQLKKQYIK